MKKGMLCTLTLLLGGLCTTTVNAQRTYHDNGSDDFIYQSVAAINENNANGLNPGYGFAYTNANAGTPAVRPEFIRTDFDGVMLSHVNYIQNNQYNSRFTHIEEISNQYLAADKQFLVVGSFENSAGSALTVALLDDMGNITKQNHLRSEEMDNLIGVKGIYNELSNEFCVVGMQCNGFSSTDDKEIIILGFDNDLNLLWSAKFNTPYNTDDHDFVTDVEIAGPHEYAIIGTSNHDNLSPSIPVTMTAVVDASAAISFNSQHFSFLSFDNGVAVVSKGPVGSGDLWIMSNARVFNGAANRIIIKHTDYVGNIIASYVLDGGSSQFLAFNMEVVHNNYLAISGYKYVGTEAIPFYVLFEPSTNTIVAQYEYDDLSNTGITTYNENDLLRMQANQNVMPYFYNEISAIRGDNGGIVFTGNDDTYSTGLGLRAYGVSDIGTIATPCTTFAAAPFTLVTPTSAVMPDLVHANAFVSEEGDFMTSVNATIDDDACGPLYKTNGGSSDLADPANIGLSVYPNPSSSSFSVSGYTNATSISVYDLSGKLIFEKAVEGEETSINLDQMATGTYLVKVMNGDALVGTEKIQLIP